MLKAAADALGVTMIGGIPGGGEPLPDGRDGANRRRGGGDDSQASGRDREVDRSRRRVRRDAFSIIGTIARRLKREVGPAAADEWRTAALGCRSYDAVLRLAMESRGSSSSQGRKVRR